jgi:hypothetical protein
MYSNEKIVDTNTTALSDKLQETHRNDIKLISYDTDTQSPEGAYVSMDVLYPLVRSFIAGMMTPNNDGNIEAQQMSKLMKTAIKGILIMYGDKLLTIMIGRDHEKPAKGVDLVEWYTNTFASIALRLASQRVYLLSVSKDGNDTTQISGLSTLTISES